MSRTPVDFIEGGSFGVNGEAGPITVRGGTEVTILTGADVLGPNSTLSADTPPALTYSVPAIDSQGSTLTIEDGLIVGGSDAAGSLGLGAAVRSDGDTLSVTGGATTGGAGVVNGQPGLYVLRPASCTVSGGVHTGGDGGDGVGGTAAAFVLPAGSAATVSGGEFHGGGGLAAVGFSIGAAVGGTLTIDDANPRRFTDGLALNLSGVGTVVVRGTGLSYSGGVLSGDFGYGSVDVPVSVLPGASLSVTGTSTELVFAAGV